MSCQIYALGRAGRALRFSLQNIPNQPDVLFLSVPDRAIKSVAQKLADADHIKLPSIIAHLSGAHSYELLAPLKDKVVLAQFHPLAALNGNGPIPPGSLCAITADHSWAINILSDLAVDMGLKPVALNPNKTTQYHAACVLTGNLSLALVQKSIDLMLQAGIQPNTARESLAQLLHSVASNLEHQEIAQALTGPIARKDFATIESHLKVLEPEVREIYQTLSSWLMP